MIMKLSLKMILILGLTGILFQRQANSATLYWYLAASISKPGIEVTQNFNKSHSDFNVVIVPGGSGNLFSKILASQTGDLYTPAAQDYLEKSKQAGLVLSSVKLLKQIPVFGLSPKSQASIRTFQDLIKPNVSIALGNANTMALGKTYLKIEQKLSPKEIKGIKNNTTVKAINVNQIVNYVKLDVVDAGIMFDTVAKSHHLSFIIIPEQSNVIETAQLITLKFTRYPEYIKIFKNYLAENKHIFSKYGFHLELTI